MVLPSIRKTGSYSVQAAGLADRKCDNWHSKHLERKELMKLKNASLQQLIGGGFGQTGPKLYAIAANHINQAVLGFTETTQPVQAATARAHQRPRPAEHARAGGQVLCRDMLPQICD